ncbi:hypothetical protein F511_06196 [Dorcoceras hygrometricum]|uniref:TRF2/HOY1 PH-like domain-containing protein n=1 Tax=Dorcoceras hygrometricum TaxID=472368 RepID=A0A2Z7CVM5_9LAMI|nr:hypothetical protein F511_06196 [Dorcoceras hygrometricum]
MVAKIYYGRRIFVWEFFDGSLKWKIEFKWNDIVAINPDLESGILKIMVNEAFLNTLLKRQPSSFRETRTQPRKHTNWELSDDFTGGQALIWRYLAAHNFYLNPGLFNRLPLMAVASRIGSEEIVTSKYVVPLIDLSSDEEEGLYGEARSCGRKTKLGNIGLHSPVATQKVNTNDSQKTRGPTAPIIIDISDDSSG